jgi:DNA-binding beta-propeller fold protein YncE
MLALIYLVLAAFVGDLFCRRFYQFESVIHRCAGAILVGVMVSSWFTYLAGLAFFWTSRPLFWANLLFFIAAIAVLSWPKWKDRIVKRKNGRVHETRAELYLPRPKGSAINDWLLIAGYVLLVSWMMFASFNIKDNKLQIANPEYSDFGPNTALMQSFAVGHNFPTEYPHFSGDRIRYHFLFYFQAGNLEFLGLDPAWSLNLLSIITLVAMLVVVMTLGEVLFSSRVVGRVGSLLFFFFGTFSYVPFLHKQPSVVAAIQAIKNQREYLPTIFPYRGDAWGTWSQVTYLNQRHFASAIGILLLVLVFLVVRYRAFIAERAERCASTNPTIGTRRGPSEVEPSAISDQPEPGAHNNAVTENARQSEVIEKPKTEEPPQPVLTERGPQPTPIKQIFRANILPGFLFSGVLLGLLPMWNSAVFIAAAAILGLLFILCPLRLHMVGLALICGVIALPQMLYLSTGSGRAHMPKLLHWGYTIDHPTTANVVKYLGFTFGFKWLLIALALIFANSLQRRFFLAVLSLLAVAFCFQFTIEVLGNQKFLHIWVIIANVFVAFALWRLWQFSLAGTTVPGKVATIVTTLLIIPGGIIDFFPIHNNGWSEVTYKNDELIDWLNKNTTPREILLTDRFVNHPILMAGRRVFYGWPYYAWSAGYDAGKRDRVYTELFENRDPWKVYQLLKENGIKYVAFDGAVRQASFIKRPNEQVYATYFPTVFEDQQNKYNSLTIYKVPDTPPAKLTGLPKNVTNMFDGGRGTERGQFDTPTGIAADQNGNILVADTGNGRIEKFSPTGTFLTDMGTKGSGIVQLGQPNGIAVDRTGNIYVADAGNHCVQKLAPDGRFLAEWKGPNPGFYGPRRIAIGPDNSIYVVDQGRTRIVKFNADGQVLAVWGSKGTGDGQFDDHTSVAVDPSSNKVYVADPINKRIQVFDSNGKFLGKWAVPEWGRPRGFEDLAIDSKKAQLYASSANMETILMFDLAGNRIGTLTATPSDRLEGPSALALANGRLYVANMFGNRVTAIER